MDVDADDFVALDFSAIRDAWDEKPAAETKAPTKADSVDPRDELLPPLHRLRIANATAEDAEQPTADHVEAAAPGKITIAVQLDKANPLQEARWVKTGEVDEWIAQNTGNSASETGWQGKIKIMDPEPVRATTLIMPVV
jgi:hypothetical protein